MNEHISDEELIRELEHWGEGDNSFRIVSALEIQRKSLVKRRSKLRLALATSTVIVAAIMSTAWYTNLRHQDAMPSEIAAESTPNARDAERLLKSIALRTQNIEIQAQELNSRWAQQHQADLAIQELNTRLLNYKRAAIRNQIALNPTPNVTQ